MVRVQRSLLFSVAFVFATSAASALQAQTPNGPRVQFDAPYQIAMREIIAPVQTQPGEKIVEARFDISSIVVAGNERDVTQFVFQLQSLQRTMQVYDYQPRSARDTSITGNVAVSEGRESSNTSGFDLTGRYQEWTSANLNFGESNKENGNRKFDRLPPLETVVASGTVFRGTGVYFKLHTTDRQLLEGSTTVCVLWRVPSNWRADYVHLRCVAEGRLRGQNQQRAGQRDFLIPVSLAGDTAAQQAAARFARSEANVRMVARQSAEEINNRPPNPFQRVFVGNNDQDVPHDWLERLLYLPANPSIPSRLPSSVRNAAGDFVAAREELGLLNGYQPATNAQAVNVSQP
ncbi:hypothetical protein [Anatilimnocola floriformis]|uniref:hypothetical protein n=1 Tax=Anatilimnocola floriformis TaxID=2948575 RepID=UPI0020C35810|nr:hypothetical protein [Anatilimnocola floriformis]